MNAAVEELLESPRLPEIVDRLQACLADERVRREKFYTEIPEGVKAEFINGKVVIHMPSRVRHLNVRDNLLQLLRAFVQTRRQGWVTGEKALCVFPRNDYEPDVCFFGPEKASQLQPEQLRLPAPDFITEVLSPSTEATDRGQKFEDYQAHGVREYWIVDPTLEVLEQYILKGDAYELVQKSGTGLVRSVVLVDFCMPIRALFDPAEHLTALRAVL